MYARRAEDQCEPKGHVEALMAEMFEQQFLSICPLWLWGHVAAGILEVKVIYVNGSRRFLPGREGTFAISSEIFGNCFTMALLY